MIAKWPGTCPKCDTTYAPGDPIKAQYKRAGYDPDTGKIQWVRVPKAYVHAPRCPKVTPNKPGQSVIEPLSMEEIRERYPSAEWPGHRTVDPTTGEILDVSPIPRHAEQLGLL